MVLRETTLTFVLLPIDGRARSAPLEQERDAAHHSSSAWPSKQVLLVSDGDKAVGLGGLCCIPLQAEPDRLSHCCPVDVIERVIV